MPHQYQHSFISRANRRKKKIVQKIKQLISSKDLLNYQLLFSINSGRSGSNYLAKLLGTAEEVVSYHESYPTMSAEYLTMVNKFEYQKSVFKRKRKNSSIKEVLFQLPEDKIYCETNHMFIKTFFDVVVQEFPKVEVIILRRYLPKILKSFIELGYFSERNKHWKFWMSSPNAATAAIPCIDVDKNLDQWDLSIAYLIDIEARAKRFQQEYPNIKTHEVRLESLNDFTNIKSLFKQLSITPTETTKKLCGQQINQRKNTKKKYSSEQEVSYSYCQERIEKYIHKAQDLKIQIPTTLALEEYQLES